MFLLHTELINRKLDFVHLKKTYATNVVSTLDFVSFVSVNYLLNHCLMNNKPNFYDNDKTRQM